jgi:hypothetical protein
MDLKAQQDRAAEAEDEEEEPDEEMRRYFTCYSCFYGAAVLSMRGFVTPVVWQLVKKLTRIDLQCRLTCLCCASYVRCAACVIPSQDDVEADDGDDDDAADDAQLDEDDAYMKRLRKQALKMLRGEFNLLFVSCSQHPFPAGVRCGVAA